jgi:RHS repeat-associated protein
MGYDGLDRLTAANGVWGTGSYTYDALDNLRSSNLGGRQLTMQVDAATNRLNAVTGWLNYPVEYDANGNVSRRGGELSVFDVANRLKSVTGRAIYYYDGHGRRVWTTYADGRHLAQGYGLSGKLLFNWDSVTGDRRYVYLGDRLIAETEHRTGITTFSHNDALGSPVARTNSAGQVVARTHYEPYGAISEGDVPKGIGFTGHVNDADTGLVYMQQRYYDPRAGRFLSVDPIMTDSKAGGFFGRYHYANSNPFAFIDPTGMAPNAMDKTLEREAADCARAALFGGVCVMYERNKDTLVPKAPGMFVDGLVHMMSVGPSGMECGVDVVCGVFAGPGLGRGVAIAKGAAEVASANNFRALFLKARPDLPSGWAVHHSFPQRYAELMRAAGINIHDVQLLRGVSPQLHSKITTEWG